MPDKTLLQKYEYMWVLLQELDDPLCMGRGDEIRALKDEIREELTDRTVYVVIQGFYSDQQVAGVFSTRPLAEEFMKLDENERCIEDFTLDELVERARQGLHEWGVSMGRDGDTKRLSNYGMCNEMHLTFARINNFVGTEAASEITLRLYCSCWARDEKHAIKITNEIRTQILAADNWHQDYVWRA